MTLQEFQKNDTFRSELLTFLGSTTGQALVSVLQTESPIQKLALTRSSVGLRNAAAADSVHGEDSANNLLGKATGWQAALNLIIKDALEAPEPERKPKASSKSQPGGRTIDREPTPPMM